MEEEEEDRAKANRDDGKGGRRGGWKSSGRIG